MNIKRYLLIFFLGTSLLGCFHEDDTPTSGFNADINGQWALTTTVTSSNCYPGEVGYQYTDIIVISETAGDIYIDGALDPDASYSNGVIRVNTTDSYSGYSYQYSMSLVFTDNDYASGTSTETESYLGLTCTWTTSITLTRI